MTAKYRIGDRLTIVGDPQEDWAGSDWYTGGSFVVAHVDVGPNYVVYWDWKLEDEQEGWPVGANCGVMEEHVMLTEIVESPLWKALK